MDSGDDRYSTSGVGPNCTLIPGPASALIDRLKMLKRQMYGRAKFDLLRSRVLHAA